MSQGGSAQAVEERSTVRAVDRALDVLLCFAEAPEWSLTEIASRVSLHKSTVHRLLASLERKGFVRKNPATEKYRIGFRILELSALLAQSDEPAVILLPEMERLRDQLGETVTLYVRDGLERVRIQAVHSHQAIRRVATLGARMPLYVGASSKVLVAFAEPEIRELVLNDASWPPSVDKDAFLRQLEEIRRDGFATSVEERELGAAAVAAPIFDRSGRLAAALSVSGPSNRFTVDVMRQHAPVIIEAASRMGKMLR